VAGLHFLPEDRAGLDKALVAGLPLAEVADSPLVQALSALVDAVLPASVPPAATRGGRRRIRR